MSDGTVAGKQPRFISLRWRFILPFFTVVLVFAMVGAYALARGSGGSMAIPQQNLLLQSSRATSERTAALYERLRTEAQRVAFTSGISAAIANHDTDGLHITLEGLARLANLDSLIVTDVAGVEALGLLHVTRRETDDYAVSTGTDLSGEAIVQGVLDEGFVGATGLLHTAEGTLLYTAVPISREGQVTGVVLAGIELEQVLSELHGSAVSNIALYGGANGELLRTTLLPQSESLAGLSLSPEVYAQALQSADRVPVQRVTLDGTPYQAAYIPFVFGPETLGVTVTIMPDNLPFALQMGQQLAALVMAALAGGIVITAYVGVSLMVERVNKVTRVAEALAAGDITARTGMTATGEIGAMGQALDQYADTVQERQDALRLTLRRQRREAEHMLTIIESLPDGVVVQDTDGRVVLINENAKKLLGSQHIAPNADLHELTEVVTDKLGPSLAPGMYALGDPRRVDVEGRMLSAQAVALTNLSSQRVGTVISLRDITTEVRRERAREAMMQQLEADIQQPLAALAQTEAMRKSGGGFTRELTRHSAALQKLIVEMRDLTDATSEGIKEEQQSLPLETLVWAVANEWRQVAFAANLTLDVQIERKGLYVLGDERRLRWAIGNIVDNAVKYTPPGGKLTLEIRGEADGQAQLRVRDNGVGITAEEMPHIFTRFYRGNPVTDAGRVLHVPGTGQGLTTAKQIIEAHAGTIRIKSKQWIGTAVYFTLPLTSPEPLELPRMAEDMMEGETIPLERRKQR
ncbi:MAG: HAMP domain-containing protein [Anaerolineaceae bacterium]|nr:HAMP domain-containing protein [Anaerolineaceae bacterium]